MMNVETLLAELSRKANELYRARALGLPVADRPQVDPELLTETIQTLRELGALDHPTSREDTL